MTLLEDRVSLERKNSAAAAKPPTDLLIEALEINDLVPNLSEGCQQVLNHLLESFVHQDLEVYPPWERELIQRAQSVLTNPEAPPFSTKIIDSAIPNAQIHLPSRTIFINLGLLQKFDCWDQVAFVLAHEIAHVVYREIAPSLTGHYKLAQSHDSEYFCDEFALRLVDLACYSVNFASHSAILTEEEIDSVKNVNWGLLSTHPATQERELRLQDLIRLNYWQNFSETPHKPLSLSERQELEREPEISKIFQSENRFRDTDLKAVILTCFDYIREYLAETLKFTSNLYPNFPYQFSMILRQPVHIPQNLVSYYTFFKDNYIKKLEEKYNSLVKSLRLSEPEKTLPFEEFCEIIFLRTIENAPLKPFVNSESEVGQNLIKHIDRAEEQTGILDRILEKIRGQINSANLSEFGKEVLSKVFEEILTKKQDQAEEALANSNWLAQLHEVVIATSPYNQNQSEDILRALRKLALDLPALYEITISHGGFYTSERLENLFGRLINRKILDIALKVVNTGSPEQHVEFVQILEACVGKFGPELGLFQKGANLNPAFLRAPAKRLLAEKKYLTFRCLLELLPEKHRMDLLDDDEILELLSRDKMTKAVAGTLPRTVAGAKQIITWIESGRYEEVELALLSLPKLKGADRQLVAECLIRNRNRILELANRFAGISDSALSNGSRLIFEAMRDRGLPEKDSFLEAVKFYPTLDEFWIEWGTKLSSSEVVKQLTNDELLSLIKATISHDIKYWATYMREVKDRFALNKNLPDGYFKFHQSNGLIFKQQNPDPSESSQIYNRFPFSSRYFSDSDEIFTRSPLLGTYRDDYQKQSLRRSLCPDVSWLARLQGNALIFALHTGDIMSAFTVIEQLKQLKEKGQFNIDQVSRLALLIPSEYRFSRDPSDTSILEREDYFVEFWLKDVPYFEYFRVHGFKDFEGLSVREQLDWFDQNWPEATQYRDIILLKLFKPRWSSLTLDERLEVLHKLHDKSRAAELMYKTLNEALEREEDFESRLGLVLGFFPEAGAERDIFLRKILSFGEVSKEEIFRVFELLSSNFREASLKESFFHGTVLAYVSSLSPEDKKKLFLWLVGAEEKPDCVREWEKNLRLNLDFLRGLFRLKNFRDDLVKSIFAQNNGLFEPHNREHLEEVITKCFSPFLRAEALGSLNMDERAKYSRVLEFAREALVGLFGISNEYKKLTVLTRLLDKVAESDETLNGLDLVCEVLSSYGVVGVKIGQILAEQPGLQLNYPLLAERLGWLKDSNPMDLSEAIELLLENPKVVRQDFKVLRMLGAASIKAALLVEINGEERVVKVLRPEANKRLMEEEEILRELQRILTPVVNKHFSLNFTLPDYSGRIFRALREELDFEREKEGAEQLAESLKALGADDEVVLQTPEIFEHLSTKWCIVEGIAPGVSYSQFSKECSEEERRKINAALQRWMIKALLEGRVIHNDLHGGNIFVDRRKDGTLFVTLIDTGSVVQIKDSRELGFLLRMHAFSAVPRSIDRYLQVIRRYLETRLLPAGYPAERLEMWMGLLSQLPPNRRFAALAALFEEAETFGFRFPWEVSKLLTGLTKAYELSKFFPENWSLYLKLGFRAL